MDHNHEIYMKRCLELAKNGFGQTRSNPMVGCVVVCEGKIIAEGYHRYYGGPHAEVEALNHLSPEIISRSTVYISLEPCSHTGKTAPCVNLLLEKDAKNVVVASVDPNPLVAGKGIAKLKSNGVNVIQGVLDAENRELNKRFFAFHEKQRPWILLKWAQSKDGYIAPVHENNYKLTGSLANILVHEWRAQEMGILVGRRTVDKDNPRLTVRHVNGINPTRIILDPQCKLNPEHAVFNGEAPTYVFNIRKSEFQNNIEWIEVTETNFLADALYKLYKKGILSVMVEGGTETLRQFIAAGLWDEARIFTAPVELKNGVLAPVIKGKNKTVEMIEEDELTVLLPLT